MRQVPGYDPRQTPFGPAFPRAQDREEPMTDETPTPKQRTKELITDVLRARIPVEAAVEEIDRLYARVVIVKVQSALSEAVSPQNRVQVPPEGNIPAGILPEVPEGTRPTRSIPEEEEAFKQSAAELGVEPIDLADVSGVTDSQARVERAARTKTTRA